MIDQAIVDRVLGCRKVCVFTGAGVSAESGIPTFRDSGGLWEKYRAEDLVTPEAFERDPVTVWRWHLWLQNLCARSEPNAAHRVIAQMDAMYPEFLLITQNIDDLHERAGTRRMVKLHGDIMEIQCLENDHLTRLSSPIDDSKVVDLASLPKCPQCGGRARPNVVWFGEMLPVAPPYIGRAFSAGCDLFMIVGTSGAVSGGYGFAQLAKMNDALIVEVNPEESQLSYLADLSIRAPACEAMSQLFHG